VSDDVVAESRVKLDAYLQQRRDYEMALAQRKSTDSKLRTWVKQAVPVTARGRARILFTDLVAPRERRRAEQLLTRSPLLLHLGSGGEHKDEWVNIDLIGDPVEVAWNFARPLPFPNGSVDGIFNEHMFECLPIADGAAFARECFRVLRPGGTLRIAVPDAGRLVQSVVEHGAGVIEETRPGRPTPILAMQEIFYWYYHRTMYDAETLTLMCHAAGFEDVQNKPYGETALPVCPDTESRRPGTLYIESRR
jgi:predicted SAM-dependent methyltransferase